MLNILPDIKIFIQILNAIGPLKTRLKKSLVFIALSSITQGFAYTCFFPLFITLGKKDFENAMQWVFIAFIFVIISSILRWIGQNYDYNGYSSLAQYELRKKLGNKFREIPLEELNKKRSGQWGAIISNNVDELTLFILTIGSVLMYGVLTPLTVSITALFFDWKIALVMLIIFPSIIPFYRWRKPAFDRGMKYLNEVHAELNSESIEYIQGLGILKATNEADKIIERLSKTIDKVEQVQAYGHGKGAKPNLLIASILETGILLTLGIGICLVVFDNSEAMIMIAIMIIVIRFSELISSFVPMTMFFSLIEDGVKKMNEMFAIKSLPEPEIATISHNNDITFSNVNFNYNGTEQLALNNINLHIPEKSIVAFVGPSGSGKTTITRMVMRYADVTQGNITIGGQNIKEYKTKDLLNKISVVFQEVYLFDDTIENNIRMAKTNATKEEIIEVAKRAQCHDFIMQLPKGYDTHLGEMGNSLSGGEKQRISIARALLKDSPIIILDEPTSSLDSLSELAIQKAIDELVKEKIVLVIAHRLSTIIGADKICVMENGKIIEEGKHQDLLNKKEKYFQLWNAESKLEELK